MQATYNTHQLFLKHRLLPTITINKAKYYAKKTSKYVTDSNYLCAVIKTMPKQFGYPS